jgi:endonuclease-8
MPEGDTIHRTADVLRRVLVGRRITDARSRAMPGSRRVPDLSRLVGACVRSVEARGKHLLIGVDNGLTLRTHMRMRGAWHRYGPGEAWRRPARNASAVIETSEAVAVCFDAPDVELLTDPDLRRSGVLAMLGPDLLARAFDVERAVARLTVRGEMQLGEALLDQQAVAGIGNVVKSEVCFMAGLSPWRLVGDLDEPSLRRALATARRVLQANTKGGPRATTGAPAAARGERLWVYGRAGRGCRRCGTPIQARRQGELARLTYWCGRCQPT